MKTHINDYRPVYLLMLLTSIGLSSCGTNEMSKDAMDILRRVPDDNVLLVSIRPDEIFGSQIVQNIIRQERHKSKFEESREHFKKELGLNLEKDVERILIMSADLKNMPASACVLIQGNMKPFNAAVDSALKFEKIGHSFHTVQGLKVIELDARKMERKGHGPSTIFLYNDDDEIIVTPARQVMERMLTIKKHGGETLANDRDFIRQFQNLKYTRHAWGIVQVEGLMDDILKKVREKKPEINIHKMEIRELQGGIYINEAVGVSFEAYCPDRDQVTLLNEAVNGFLALGKLTFGSLPEIRKILDGIEILKIDARIVVNIRVSLEQLAALEKLKEM